MITHVKGKLVEKKPSLRRFRLQWHRIFTSNILTYLFKNWRLGSLYVTYSSINKRRCTYTLYGFSDKAERELFRLLISVSGVGPNTAQMILSSLSPSDAQQAILSENVSLLKSVKGIGTKTAQRIILDLKDKLAKQGLEVNHSFSKHNTTREEALSALTMLGFSKNAVEKIIDKELQKIT